VRREEIVEAAARHELAAYARLDIVAARGEGCWIEDLDGTRYLDLYGGHAVALLGHSPRRVADAIAAQAGSLLFYSNLVHLPARARASRRLARLAPWPDAQVFFVNSGAEANETALKIARKATGRRETVAFEGGFHGRTLGALAACGMETYRAAATPLVDGFRIAPFHAGGLERIDESVAAVLVEPIQSMAGVRALSPDFARELRRRCDDTGALLVFDEVQTAPARTGFWFAGERWDLVPDLITTAKGIASGFPAGVVLARRDVARSVAAGDQGTTFGGGPLACAAIDATLAELEEIDAPARARAIEKCVRGGLEGVLGHGALLGVRVPGPETVQRLREEHHVLVGGCPGDKTIVRLLPPLNIELDELERGLDAIRRVS
jgi:acetylornithine aminotransferase/acetylornithine/N-succinyldiaminopimelate aminotransferase